MVQLVEQSRAEADGGAVFHIVRNTDTFFNGFGEAYLTTLNPLAVKGMRRHLVGQCILTVLVGEVEFIIEKDQIEQNILVGGDKICRLVVPIGTWFAFRNLSNYQAKILNILNVKHSEDIVEKR